MMYISLPGLYILVTRVFSTYVELSPSLLRIWTAKLLHVVTFTSKKNNCHLCLNIGTLHAVQSTGHDMKDTRFLCLPNEMLRNTTQKHVCCGVRVVVGWLVCFLVELHQDVNCRARLIFVVFSTCSGL